MSPGHHATKIKGSLTVGGSCRRALRRPDRAGLTGQGRVGREPDVAGLEGPRLGEMLKPLCRHRQTSAKANVVEVVEIVGAERQNCIFIDDDSTGGRGERRVALRIGAQGCLSNLPTGVATMPAKSLQDSRLGSYHTGHFPISPISD